jgi:hypothetical protein
VSRRDEQRLQAIETMTDPSQPTTVTHWLTAAAGHASGMNIRPGHTDTGATDPT